MDRDKILDHLSKIFVKANRIMDDGNRDRQILLERVLDDMESLIVGEEPTAVAKMYE